MNRKAQQLELEAAIAAVNNARDWGADYFKRYPNLMLVEVAREAAERFEPVNLQIVFLQGYSRARMQHEEFLLESER